MRRHAIKFMEDENEFERLGYYAKAKGFSSRGALARFAVYAYMKRSPLRTVKRVKSIGPSK